LRLRERLNLNERDRHFPIPLASQENRLTNANSHRLVRTLTGAGAGRNLFSASSARIAEASRWNVEPLSGTFFGGGVGLGVGLGVGPIVGTGVGVAVGFGVGLGVGMGVGFGVGAGVGVGVGLPSPLCPGGVGTT
jgi:hypothetical protein